MSPEATLIVIVAAIGGVCGGVLWRWWRSRGQGAPARRPRGDFSLVWTVLVVAGLGCLTASAAVAFGLAGGLAAGGLALLAIAWDGRH